VIKLAANKGRVDCTISCNRAGVALATVSSELAKLCANEKVTLEFAGGVLSIKSAGRVTMLSGLGAAFNWAYSGLIALTEHSTDNTCE
jgi:hypothetical protein